MKTSNNQFKEYATIGMNPDETLLMKHPDKISSFSEADRLKLMHELEAARIMLQMQNEELALANEKAEKAAEKYTELFEFSATAYAILAGDGEITELNHSCARLLGKDYPALLNMNVRQFIPKETLTVFDSFLKNIVQSKTKGNCELMLETGMDSRKFVHVDGFFLEYSKKCLLTLIDISARKEAEEKLLENTRRLASRLSHSPAAFIVWNADFTISGWEGAAEKIFGWTPAETLGMQAMNLKIFTEEDLPRLQLAITNLTEGSPEQQSFQCRNYRKDGSLLHCEWFSSSMKNEQGKVITVMSQVVDITAQVQAAEAAEKRVNELHKEIVHRQRKEEELREALKKMEAGRDSALNLMDHLRTELDELRKGKTDLIESEEKFRAIVSNMEDVVFLTDAGGLITYSSPSASKVFGHHADEMKGRRLEEYVMPDDRQKINVMLQGAIRMRATSQPLPVKALHKDGEIFVAEFIVRAAVKNERAESVMVFVRDVSENENTIEALKESNEKNSNLIQALNTGLGMMNEALDFNFANSAAATMFGVETDALAGRNVKEFILAIALDELLRNLAKTREGLLHHFELAIITESGNRRQLHISATAQFDKQENFEGCLFEIKDITESKKAEMKMLTQIEKAFESDKFKSAFMSDITHEIRTPLNAIIGYLELLSDDDIEGYSKDEIIKIIKENSQQLLLMVNDIIDFSKLEAGSATLSMQPAKLSDIFTKVEEIFRLTAQKKGLDFITSIDLPDRNLRVITDETKLRQVLINLVGNAIKFTQTGSVQFGCSFHNAGELLFYVKDTGIGIAKEYHAQIFERFRQSGMHDSAKYGGTGLGLSISKSFVEMMGGHIWIDSAPGKGSVFYFTLPFTAEAV